MEEALLARLRANGPLAALVGNRIDWGERPAGDPLPGLVLRAVSAGRSYAQEGADGLSAPRIRATCWGRSYKEAKLISRALEAAITPPLVVGGIAFQQSFLALAVDQDPEDVPGGQRAFSVISDFIVWWRATS